MSINGNSLLRADDRHVLYARARILALVTVFYNLVEGLVSVGLGISDETVALFGFGLDSFVEVMSGIGVWHMINRIQKYGDTDLDSFERRALQITGMSFYLLTGGLIVTAVINLGTGHRPETTFWGIIISLVSIGTMWLLISFKRKVGRALNSDAILSDAECTRACLLLSIVLLIASTGYELTGIGRLDALGALGIAWFAWREGKEAFQKAAGKNCCCHGSCSVNSDSDVTRDKNIDETA